MANGVLKWSEFLGGPDQVIIEEIFPSTQRTLQYNFSQNIASWVFHADYQTLVVDEIAYTRDGDPNFANSTVIGFFTSSVITTSTNISVTNTATGLVNITIPKNMYTGPIYADARKNVPITVVGVSWTDAGSPPATNTHRWAFIQCYEPGVAPTDPTQAAGYTAIS